MTNLGPGTSLHQRGEQEQRLLPRLVQAVEVLQLPLFELEGFLREAFEENVALDLEEGRAPGERALSRPPSGAGSARDEWLEAQPARELGLTERVREQVLLLEVGPVQRGWIEIVVECLDDDGLLRVSDGRLLEFARARGLTGDSAELADAVRMVQGLDPPGLGGRDTVEALLLQLDPEEPDHELLRRLLREFFDDLLHNRLPRVARAMGLDLGRLGELLEVLRGLDPRPGASLVGSTAPPIMPDVIVEADGEDFSVRIERSCLPSVSIDAEVASLAAGAGVDPEARCYLRSQLQRARWLVEAVERRHATLLRVAQAVFARQRDFLDKGAGNLRPLRMATLADELGLHVSTVSRAVAGKYAWTPRGLLSLRELFQAPASGMADRAKGDVSAALRRVIDAEDAAQPLSDVEIAALLLEEGLRLSRRSVANYRRQLGIPSSYLRRRFD